MLNVIMLNVAKKPSVLSVIILNVIIMLSVPEKLLRYLIQHELKLAQ
jgi:hypothetical protein